MAYALRVLALNGVVEFPPDDDFDMRGLFVIHCDVDAYGGRGFVEFTDDVHAARAFVSPSTAMDYWRRTSRVRPTRNDGRPNRPLTAYTIEVIEI